MLAMRRSKLIVGLVTLVALGLVAVLPGASVSVAAIDGAGGAIYHLTDQDRAKQAFDKKYRHRHNILSQPQYDYLIPSKNGDGRHVVLPQPYIIPSKNGWHKFVGKKGEDAAQLILNEIPYLQVHLVYQGTFVTSDYRSNRVRIYVDEDDLVVLEPKIE